MSTACPNCGEITQFAGEHFTYDGNFMCNTYNAFKSSVRLIITEQDLRIIPIAKEIKIVLGNINGK